MRVYRCIDRGNIITFFIQTRSFWELNKIIRKRLLYLILRSRDTQYSTSSCNICVLEFLCHRLAVGALPLLVHRLVVNISDTLLLPMVFTRYSLLSFLPHFFLHLQWYVLPPPSLPTRHPDFVHPLPLLPLATPSLPPLRLESWVFSCKPDSVQKNIQTSFNVSDKITWTWDWNVSSKCSFDYFVSSILNDRFYVAKLQTSVSDLFIDNAVT